MSSENNSVPQADSPLIPIFRGLGRNLIFRGILEIVFGALLLIVPDKTITILTYVIGVALILSGATQLLAAALSKSSKKSWSVINGIVLLLFGVITVCSPLLMEYLWIVVLGLWLIVSGINEFFGGGWRRLWGIISCILSVAIGVIFIALPFASIGAIVMIVGWVFITSGFLALCAGIDMRVASRKL